MWKLIKMKPKIPIVNYPKFKEYQLNRLLLIKLYAYIIT